MPHPERRSQQSNQNTTESTQNAHETRKNNVLDNFTEAVFTGDLPKANELVDKLNEEQIMQVFEKGFSDGEPHVVEAVRGFIDKGKVSKQIVEDEEMQKHIKIGVMRALTTGRLRDAAALNSLHTENLLESKDMNEDLQRGVANAIELGHIKQIRDFVTYVDEDYLKNVLTDPKYKQRAIKHLLKRKKHTDELTDILGLDKEEIEKAA